MDDLIFRVVKPTRPYTNFTYLTTSPPPGGAFWVFPPRPSLWTCRKTQTLLAITVFGLLTKQTELGCSGTRLNLSCQPENQQEIPTNCSPAALGNVSNGCDVSISQEHQPKLVLSDLWWLLLQVGGIVLSEEGNGISLFVVLNFIRWSLLPLPLPDSVLNFCRGSLINNSPSCSDQPHWNSELHYEKVN